jgi:hypothetical protein
MFLKPLPHEYVCSGGGQVESREGIYILLAHNQLNTLDAIRMRFGTDRDT